MATVYVETTIPSYLAARPSRNLVLRAQQDVTHTWWRTARDRFRLLVSVAVLEEAAAGDPAAAARRLALLSGIRILPRRPSVEHLARLYERRLQIPAGARADAVHIAFAVAYEVDYVVTWNCAHIANGWVMRRLMEVNQGLRRFTPVLVTPQELMAREGETNP